jgi:hypothetical protein
LQSKKEKFYGSISPMLATLVDKPLTSPDGFMK